MDKWQANAPQGFYDAAVVKVNLSDSPSRIFELRNINGVLWTHRTSWGWVDDYIQGDKIDPYVNKETYAEKLANQWGA